MIIINIIIMINNAAPKCIQTDKYTHAYPSGRTQLRDEL